MVMLLQLRGLRGSGIDRVTLLFVLLRTFTE